VSYTTEDFISLDEIKLCSNPDVPSINISSLSNKTGSTCLFNLKQKNRLLVELYYGPSLTPLIFDVY
jgi:hypothetical protein